MTAKADSTVNLEWDCMVCGASWSMRSRGRTYRVDHSERWYIGTVCSHCMDNMTEHEIIAVLRVKAATDTFRQRGVRKGWLDGVLQAMAEALNKDVLAGRTDLIPETFTGLTTRFEKLPDLGWRSGHK